MGAGTPTFIGECFGDQRCITTIARKDRLDCLGWQYLVSRVSGG